MKIAVAVLGAMTLVACGEDGGDEGGPDKDKVESAAFTFDMSNPDATCDTPAGPWGLTPGHLVQDWTITDCDENPYTLYNNDFCTAKATVLVQSEGWCAACIDDAVNVKAQVVDPYTALGVRFMEVLSTDQNSSTIASPFCHEWAGRYGIEGHTFMDPESKLSTYTYTPGVDEEPSGSSTQALPVVRVLDSTGTLVDLFEGSDPNWDRVRETLDALLAE